MPENKRIEVLLSTYNGQRFLREQLASIESQTVEDLRLRVRDDGSTDGTVTLLEEYSAEREWVTFYLGENLGVIGSFMWLLDSVSDETEWAAFCDQDDVWYADKLQRARQALESCSRKVPAMYFSSVRLVNESRREIGITSPCKMEPGFLNALVQNVATGCTVVLNRAAIDLFRNREVRLSNIGMHDWWAYLVVSAFGKVICDDVPSMEYRQHTDNVVGSKSGLARWMKRISRFRRRSRTELVDYVKELMQVYGDELPLEKKEVCREFIYGAGSSSVFVRLKYVWSAPIYRHSKFDDVLMRVLIGLGWR